MRLTPHRHPRRFAPRAPKPSARPNGQTEQNKQGSQKVSKNFLGRGAVTEQIGRVAAASRLKAKFTATRRRRRGRSPLTRLAIRPLYPSRHALIFTVMRFAMSLSGAALLLRGLPVRYILPLSSIQSCRRGVFSCPLNHRGRRCPRP